MSRTHVYHEIISSPLIYEVPSINEKQVSIRWTIVIVFLLNTLVVAWYLIDVFSVNIVFDGFNLKLFLLFELIFMPCCMLPLFLLGRWRRMKLIFTERGIALYPSVFIGGIPLSDLVAERWDDIEYFSFEKLPKLMAIGSSKSKNLFLHVYTKGIIPRCVNNYGISVFAITGHLLNEEDKKIISTIFAQFKIPEKEH